MSHETHDRNQRVLTRWVFATVLLCCLASQSQPVWAQTGCGAFPEPVLANGLEMVCLGEPTTIQMQLNAGVIQGGTDVTITEVLYAFSCDNLKVTGNPFDLDDCNMDGSPVSYVGDISIEVNTGSPCSDAAGVICWTGTDLGNGVRFLADRPVVIPANQSCFFEFDIVVTGFAAVDPTNRIDQAAKFNGACDNGEVAEETSTLILLPELCPNGNLRCRVTQGGNLDGGGQVNKTSFGGQAGAPSAGDPDSQAFGEWTHTNHNGPAGKFTFHGGTSSASEGTEILMVGCRDEGFCNPARPAPAKQIDIVGIGEFENINSRLPSLDNVVAKETLHYFTVHVEDLGEPGSNGLAYPAPECPEMGTEPPDGLGNCECRDFYIITIYEAFAPGMPPNTTDVIYTNFGYLDGGNMQIHPLIGGE